jgi:hypothetical protein
MSQQPDLFAFVGGSLLVQMSQFIRLTCEMTDLEEQQSVVLSFDCYPPVNTEIFVSYGQID